MNIDHPYPNELEIVLISPSGTESVLAEPHSKRYLKMLLILTFIDTGNNPIIRWGNDNSLWYSGKISSFGGK